MTAYPNMVAGPDRFDTAIMRLGNGKIVAKAGAEGYQGLAVVPGALGTDSPGLGIAIKIADGDRRGSVRPVVAIEVLRQLGLLDAATQQELSAYGPVVEIKNWRKLVVGEMHPIFKLNYK
jgi:L-asparaginase II